MSHPYASAPTWADPQQPGTPWQPDQPRQSHGLSVTALVLSCLAVVLALIALVTMMFSGGSDTMRGTAPQVVAGRPYPGPRLQAEVTAVLQDYGYDVSRLGCPTTQEIQPGVSTTCTGEVDGVRERVTVTFTDTAGHFTLAES